MIKGVLFDIDDTLYSHKLKAVPSLTIKALDKLREKGIKIGICTSRIIAEMQFLPRELMERIDCQIMGTGSVTMVSGKYFKSYTINKDEVRRYIDFFTENNISYHYSDINGDTYFCGDESMVNEGKTLRFATGRIMFKAYEDEDITNIFFYHVSESQLEYIRSVNPSTYISMWNDCGNIGPQYVDKGFGVLKFCQVFSLTTDEVMAFGDGNNDDVMLEMAGIGVAVKGAKQRAIDAADIVCSKTIEDGGIYEVLVEKGIIRDEKYRPEIFFFDLDSTTFDHGIHDVRDSTYIALQKLKDKGYKLCICTSRSLEECYNIPERFMKMMDCLVLLAGAYIVKGDEVIIDHIDKETVDKCIDFCNRNELTYRYSTDNGGGYLNRSEKDTDRVFYSLYNMIPEAKKYDGEKVLQILYYPKNDDQYGELKSLAPVAEHMNYGFAVEIYPYGTDKGTAILKVADMFGIDHDKICAFGDGNNDVTMMKNAGLGIAMGNGSDSCKQAADYITDDISEEGLYNALRHFRIIE